MPPRVLPPLLDRREGVKGALLHTLPGRAIVVGVAIKAAIAVLTRLAGPLPLFVRVVDTVAGLSVAVGATYFLAGLIILAKRRLLWRVRRKLILSYIFIGFVPALLIVAFFLLSGFLLFFNLGSYMVQAKLRSLAEQAQFLAQSAALEIQRAGGRDVEAIVQRRQTNAAAQYPDVSVAVLALPRTCEPDPALPTPAASPARVEQPKGASGTGAPATLVSVAGPWRHLDPPPTMPEWILCSGFAGLLTYSHAPAPSSQDEDSHLLVRGVAFPDTGRAGLAVVVDLLVNDRVKEQLQKETGIEMKMVTVAPPETPAPDKARPLRGRAGGHEKPGFVFRVTGLLSNVPGLMAFRDWDTGVTGMATVRLGLNVSDLYDRISAVETSKGQSVAQGLLLVLFFIGALFLIIEFVALVAGLALARSITGSVHALFAGTERVRQGDFTHKIAVQTEDQLGELAGSFNSMTASIEDLLIQAAEKKRLEEELRIAHEMQMSLLPQGPLVMPGLSVTALCVPAREVGGDYYDFLPLDDHRVGVLIADVSGKGTSAAFYMAELKGLILSLTEIHASPREMLIAANRIIAAHLDSRSFITITYAIIDMRARTMTYARAGHTPLIYVSGRHGDRRVQILTPDGMVLGLKLDNGEMFERLLEEETIQLNSGDLYLFFTDGISEAMNVHDDCFGEGRLGELIESHAHLPSDQLRERVLREIAAFVGEAPQHDDMTMILLKVDDLAAPEPLNAELAGIAE